MQFFFLGTLSRMDALSWRGPSSDVWVPAVLRGEGPLAEGGPRAGTLRAKQGLRPTVPSTGVATGEGVTVVSVGRKITGGRGFSHVEGAPNHGVPKPGGGGGKLTCIQRWRRGLLHLCVTAGNSSTVRTPTPNTEGPFLGGRGGGRGSPVPTSAFCLQPPQRSFLDSSPPLPPLPGLPAGRSGASSVRSFSMFRLTGAGPHRDAAIRKAFRGVARPRRAVLLLGRAAHHHRAPQPRTAPPPL